MPQITETTGLHDAQERLVALHQLRRGIIRDGGGGAEEMANLTFTERQILASVKPARALIAHITQHHMSGT